MKDRTPVLCLLLSLCGVYASSVQAAESASVTGTLVLTNDCVFPGQTQTDRDPAVQGGIEFASVRGFHAGAWGSNISWLSDAQDSVSSSLEVDGSGGFRGTWGEAVSYDVLPSPMSIRTPSRTCTRMPLTTMSARQQAS